MATQTQTRPPLTDTVQQLAATPTAALLALQIQALAVAGAQVLAVAGERHHLIAAAQELSHEPLAQKATGSGNKHSHRVLAIWGASPLRCWGTSSAARLW